VSKIIQIGPKLLRFLLAAFLWLHAVFLLRAPSGALEFVRSRIHFSAEEITLFLLLLLFSFVSGPDLGKTILNLLYVYFFPFILLFYAVYWPIRLAILFWKRHKPPLNEGREITVAATEQPTLTILGEMPGQKKSKETITSAILEVATRPFRKFVLLWCLLVVFTTHLPVLWLSVIILFAQLARKMYVVLEITWSSRSAIERIVAGIPNRLDEALQKLYAIDFEVTPVADLRNLLNQIRGLEWLVKILGHSPRVSRWIFGIGLTCLLLTYGYFGFLFSFGYVGLAKLSGVFLPWVDSLVTSIFIPFYVADLPKIISLRILGGIHCTLLAALGIGTVLNYFRQQLEPLKAATTLVSVRLSEQEAQTRYLVLQQKVESEKPNTPK
jgi:hypothetical protein